MRVMARFMAAATDAAHFPAPRLPEGAVLGRSQRGKPRPEVIFADLPGYGYAKLSREISQEWPKFIEPYLNERPTLALCLALVDVNVPPQDSDRQLLDFLNASGREFLVIATKSDRLSNNELRNALKGLTEAYPTARVVPFSAKTRVGRDEVWNKIRQCAAEFPSAAFQS